MTVEDFQTTIRRAIQKYFDGNGDGFKYFGFDTHQFLKFVLTENKDTVKEIQHEFQFTLSCDGSVLDFSIQTNHTYGEDEDERWTSVTLSVPKSEEEHFQMSTVKDILFDWEFFEYLSDVFLKLREGNSHD